MPDIKQRRLKIITFSLGATEFSAQITSWSLDPGIKTGDRVYTFNAEGEGHNSFIEETDGEPTLDVKFLSDWTVGGLSDFLWTNNMSDADFILDHHPDITGEHVRWSGSLQIQAPPSGGDARTTESQEITFPIIGTPTYERVS